MSCPDSELERGAVCLALYPYTTGFPLDRVLRDSENDLLAQLETANTVEEIAATIQPGTPPPEIAVTAKLRRVLLLQTGTNPNRQDIAVARINSINDKKRAQESWYLSLQSGIHAAHYLIGQEERHGTGGKEAYVDGLSLATVRKAAILRRTGLLNEDEMRAVSERLVRTMELDLSSYFASLSPKT